MLSFIFKPSSALFLSRSASLPTRAIKIVFYLSLVVTNITLPVDFDMMLRKCLSAYLHCSIELLSVQVCDPESFLLGQAQRKYHEGTLVEYKKIT